METNTPTLEEFQKVMDEAMHAADLVFWRIFWETIAERAAETQKGEQT